MADVPFVVRLLPNNILKAAFRVHLAPEALQYLHLKVGDLCTIVSEDGSQGAAIAWRATDKMGSPKTQPAKMSEILCETYGLKQGTQVRIEKTLQVEIQLATKVSLVEVTPIEFRRENDDMWKSYCVSILCLCEAIAPGMTFDVNMGDSYKKRYYIEHIDSQHTADTPSLYKVNDNTTYVMLGIPETSSVLLAQEPFRLNTAHIGGLVQQIEQLNDSLRKLCDKTRDQNKKRSNPGILIQGYAGTGKTLLLDALSKAPLRKVVRLKNEELTPTKSTSVINVAFQQALSAQPSAVLIDRLDEICPVDAPGVTTALCTAVDSTLGTDVLVVATARSALKVNEDLLEPNRLRKQIDLPVPDLAGRTHILSVLLDDRIDTEVLTSIGASTHGYTGRDLEMLVNLTIDLADTRRNREQENWSSSFSARTLVDGQDRDKTITQADIETILKTIRPSALREVIIEPPNISFDDIGGSAEIRSRFDKIIRWPLEYPEYFSSQRRTGVLLYGPPGCSKTMTAQAVARTFKLNFIAIKGAELISMYVGESERAIRDIFRKARQAAPSIIFFDEIDSIAAAREDHAKGLNVLTTLLNEMDGFEVGKDVIVLAATNRPASLDSAILRSGRFDEQIYLGPPNADARKAIFQICCPQVEMQAMVEKSEGMSGAEIKNAWSLAYYAAVERKILGGANFQVTEQDLLDGIAKTPRVITTEMIADYQSFAMRATA